MLPCMFRSPSPAAQSRLHLFLPRLLSLQESVGEVDGGARFFVVSQLLMEAVQVGGELLLSATPSARDDAVDLAAPETSLRDLLSAVQVQEAMKEEVGRWFGIVSGGVVGRASAWFVWVLCSTTGMKGGSSVNDIAKVTLAGGLCAYSE